MEQMQQKLKRLYEAREQATTQLKAIEEQRDQLIQILLRQQGAIAVLEELQQETAPPPAENNGEGNLIPAADGGIVE